MNEHLSSASLKTLAKGQLLGKYGTLVGAYGIHIACVLFATLCDLLFVDTTTLIGIIIYYADGKETLWDVAKKFRVAPDTIRNATPEDTIVKGQKLILISR